MPRTREQALEARRLAAQRRRASWSAEKKATAYKKREEWRAKRRAAGLKTHSLSTSEIRNQNLLAKYGITTAQWEEIFDFQDRKCAVCGTANAAQWATDHCHLTGQIRGILCGKCNALLGLLGDNAARAASAFARIAGYLGDAGDPCPGS